MTEAGIVKARRGRKRKNTQYGRNSQDCIDLRLHVNPAKRPAIDPGAEAGFISRVEQEQRYIADRARGGTVPLPIRRNAYRQTNTSCTEIHFAKKSIQTTVTDDGRVAENWVNQQTGQKIVGFDLEWRPNFRKGMDNKTALIQLCTDNGCLIIQMLFLNFIPEALVRFLKDPGVKLVGVGIERDVVKLRNDHGLECRGQLELGTLAVERFERRELKEAGLKGLAMEVLGLSLAKPKSISMSNWACRTLQEKQVEYACIDAYVSFAIGKKLLECKK
jgi:hypothetical protein